MSDIHSDPPESLERVVNVPCNACGSEMTYDPGVQMLLCGHCGNKKDLPREVDMVIERSFSGAVHLADKRMGFDLEAKVFHCNNCGANTAVDPDQVRFTCPFCSSENVNEEAHESRVIRPSGILPFKITRQNALDKFKGWLKKGWFRPNSLSRLARLEGIRSVYLPFWTYDADTRSNWTAMSGYYYYVTESYTDSEGNRQTRQVRKTRWVPSSGYYEQRFDDVLILGSHGLTQEFTQRIFPFEMEGVVNYDTRYMLGHESEVYQKDVKEGFEVADKIMDHTIRQQISSRVPGDTHRNLSIHTQKDHITFKHLLLPIWIAAYQYRKKVYRFLVNGQTGKISGKKPIAWWKVIALILFLAGVGVGLFLAFGQ